MPEDPGVVDNHHHDRIPPPAGAQVSDFRRWTAFCLLTVAILGFYWRYTLTNQFIWFSGDDFLHQVLPWFQFQAGEIHRGRPPLWDPNHYLGQPLVGQAQPGAVYPLNWLLFSLPLRDGWIKEFWLNWYYVFIHLMAAWFAYSLAREIRVSRAGSVISGAVFSLAAWLGTTTWPQMINGAVWTPLVFRFIVRAARGGPMMRNAVFGGFFLGLAWLSGHHQIPVFTSLAAGGAWIWIAARSCGRRNAARALAAALVFFALAGSTAAIQILPGYEYGKLSARWVGVEEPIGWNTEVPYVIHREYSFHPASLLGIVFPGMTVHSDPFLGVAVVLLAAAAIGCAWARAEVRLFTAVGAAALLFSLAGHAAPLHGVLYALVPLVEKARSPSMAIHIFAFAASILAGAGFDVLRREEHRAVIRRLAHCAWALAAVVFTIQVAIVLVKGFQGGNDDRPLMAALSAFLAGALLHAAHRGALGMRVLAVCLGGLFLAEVSNTNSHYDPALREKDRVELERARALSRHSDIAAFLRAHGGLARVDVDSSLIPYNFGDWYGLPQSGGYLASLTKNVTRVEMHAPHGRRLFGIEYLVSNKPAEPGQEEVFSSRSGLKVYRTPGVFPRAFAVHEAERLPAPDRTAGMMFDLRDDLRWKTFVPGRPPDLERCAGPDSVEILSYEPGRVRIAADMACRGMVILTDTWFPGWRAEVDGEPAVIHEAYGVVRGVVVERGAHTIEMRYRPLSVLAGGLLSAAATLLAAGVWLAGRNR
jgi:hypothetical protein